MLLFRSQYSTKKYVTGTQLCGLRDHQSLMWKISLLIGRGHFLIVILRKTHVCWVKILGVWRARSSPDTTLRMELKSWSIQKRFNPIVWGAEDEIQHALGFSHHSGPWILVFFPLRIFVCIYLFMYGFTGSLLLRVGFLCFQAQASHCRGFLVEHELWGA